MRGYSSDEIIVQAGKTIRFDNFLPNVWSLTIPEIKIGRKRFIYCFSSRGIGSGFRGSISSRIAA
jgi:hypothetical protein